MMNKLLFCIFLISIFHGCGEVPSPKPRGYFRIDLPEKEYISTLDTATVAESLPVNFEYPVYGNIDLVSDSEMEPGWFNINFPEYRAKIYFTYKKVENDLGDLMEQAYKMNVKNHVIKADAINEQLIADPENDIYGILYSLKGSTATAVQFFVTDSTANFFRGSLYFEAVPNQDSLAPVIDFFKKDIEHIIETLCWKE
jgi:gliding motility-associated lipoprotein GldD